MKTPCSGRRLTVELEVRLEAGHLPPVRVPLDLEVDQPEVVAVEDDHPRTRAEDRTLEAADRLLEPVQADQPHDRGGLAAGDHQPVEAVELLGQAHLDHVCAERHAARARARGTPPARREPRCVASRSQGNSRDGRSQRNAVACRSLRHPDTGENREARFDRTGGCCWHSSSRHRRWRTSPARTRRPVTGGCSCPNPVAELQDQSLTDQKDADYAALQPAYHTVDADEPRRQRLPHRATGRTSAARPATRPTRRRTVPVRPQRRPVRAGDGLLLDHRGAEVHPEPRLRLDARPVNKESQDIRINQSGVDNSFSWDKKDVITLRQGRRRRRRGRRGDPPRVRPRDPGLAAGCRSASGPPSSQGRSARASPTTGP